MRHARLFQGGLGVFLLGWVLSLVGCTHNHYYGPGVPVCGPTPVAVPATISNGAVCEVPTQVQVDGGSVVAQGSGRSTIVSGVPVYSGATAPRVVVSEPSSSPRFGRWQRANPEMATTRVEGAYNDSTTNR
ncbi:hypothetical protein SAMN05444166_7018 [Singulisphaera sp. GP187]|uniref:hypothetical protein n=1 Tax=Singulisphaera sp. GP187 TaxID=1882752 RepID=UPI000925D468|nr:hypothetical protein [Singulisphaera sp. GP187]SIO62344.1 hypothetical protein SAMN05444166_7018 [Singulisphaera sp. GP187]